MSVFISLCVFTILFYLLIKQHFKKTYRKIYIAVMFLILTLIMGLRSIYVAGVDTSKVYKVIFEYAQGASISQIALLSTGTEYGFSIFTKLFTLISTDYQLYLLTISIFVIYSFCRFIYKYSDNLMYSFILFYSLGYYGIEFQLLRHAIAVSILLFAFDYLKNAKKIKFIIVVILASTFHVTALIFLTALFLKNIKIDKKTLLYLLAGLIVVFLFSNQISNIIISLLGSSTHYSHYISDITNSSKNFGYSGFFILLFVFLISYFLLRKTEKKDMALYLNFSLASVLLMSLVNILGEFYRLSMYFGIYNCVLLPNVLKTTGKIRQKEKMLINVFMYSVFIFYFLFFGLENAGLNDFKFFWQ